MKERKTAEPQTSGAVRPGRWAWVLIRYPILRPVPNKAMWFLWSLSAMKERKTAEPQTSGAV